jgi:hypothetical protein
MATSRREPLSADPSLGVPGLKSLAETRLDIEGELRVVRDADLQRDLDEAKRRTGIRSDTEVTRLALRRLATGAA